MAVFRVQQSQPATLTHTFYEYGEETPTAPTGTPTYAITDANGTSIASGNASVSGTEVSASLSGQSTTKLLTVTWTATVDGATVVERDTVEVVGGFFFTLAAARNSDSSLADTSKFTTAELRDKRFAVEAECEMICDRTFVPRYARVVLDGTGTADLVLTHPDEGRSLCDVRSIRSVSMADEVDETFTAFTAGELADLALLPDGVTIRRSGGDVFTAGSANVVVEYEYGLLQPPPDLVDMALLRLRSMLGRNRTGIPDRATSYTAAGDGGTYRIDLPGAWKTGIPDVDAVYDRYSRRKRGGNAVPASRRLDFNPRYWSLFHGGVR